MFHFEFKIILNSLVDKIVMKDAENLLLLFFIITSIPLLSCTNKQQIIHQVSYNCPTMPGGIITVNFMTQGDPKKVLVFYKGQTYSADRAPSGSGVRYIGPDIELWEHQRKSVITIKEKKYSCSIKADNDSKKRI